MSYSLTKDHSGSSSCLQSIDSQICAGATFFDWTKDGINEDEETPVQLQTDADSFAAEMEAKGVGTDRPVVVRLCTSSSACARQHCPHSLSCTSCTSSAWCIPLVSHHSAFGGGCHTTHKTIQVRKSCENSPDESCQSLCSEAVCCCKAGISLLLPRAASCCDKGCVAMNPAAV